MVHSTQDYSGKYRQEVVYGNIDNGELATRTFPLTSVDRRGNVVWFDDFEAAASKWKRLLGAAGSSVALSANYAWHGNQSMALTTAAIINDVVGVQKLFSLPFGRRMGSEFMFLPRSGKPLVLLWVVGYDGTNLHEAVVRYNYNTDELQYQDSAAAWQDLTVYDKVDTSDMHWIPMKLVVDWDNNEYVRLLFAGTEYDLSGIAMRTAADAAQAHIYVIIYNYAITAAVAATHIDNFIFTQNE